MPYRRFVSAVAIVILPIVLIACGERPQADPRTAAPLVRVTTIQDAVARSYTFTGTVAARVQSDLGFRVSGKVLERLVDTGQTVKRGQPLMRIDPADLNLLAKAQQESVAAARAKAQQTAEDEARYRNLRGTGAISASTYDQALAAADGAKAQLKATEAQAEVASNASHYALLIADADGVVMETLAEPGQVVNVGQVVIRIAHAGHREAVIQLPETLRPAIGSTGQASLFEQKGSAVAAKLRQLSDAADRQTRTFEARYVLNEALANAPLGTTVTIQIPDTGHAEQEGLRVPISALYNAGKGSGIWVIEGEPAKVSWRAVKVLHLDDDGAYIAGQIKKNDRVVALGAHLLREGEQVRVASQTATASVTAGTLP
jgi:RND family efflux transporter MFP subunit